MKDRLRELMKTSAENGQPVWNWNPELVADSILDFVDGFEDEDYDRMVSTIKEIQEER